MPRKPAALLDLAKHYTPDDLTLVGLDSERLLGRLTGIPVTRTMLGTSTVTLQLADKLDGRTYELLTGPRPLDVWDSKGRLRKNITLTIDGLRFTLTELEKTTSGLELTFVDWIVAAMMNENGSLKAKRDDSGTGRAAFIRRLADAAKVPFLNPQGNVPLPIADVPADQQKQIDKAEENNAERTRENREVSRGAFTGRKFTIKGAQATASQKRAIADALRVAGEENVSARARKALILAGINESNFDVNARNNSTGAAGVYQVLASTAAAVGVPYPASTSDGAKIFLVGINGLGFRGAASQWTAEAMAKNNPGWSSAQIANEVEGSGAGEAFYNAHADEAERILQIWTNSDDAKGDDPVGALDQVEVDYGEYAVNRGENYWTTGRRLADEVRTRLYASVGRLVYATDHALASQPQSYSMVEGENGIDQILWLITDPGRIDTLNVTARTTPWAAPPGTVVGVYGQGAGVDGHTWLVREISRDLMDPSGTAQITLGLPQSVKKEPAPTATVTQGSDPAADVVPAAGGKVTGLKGMTPQEIINKYVIPLAAAAGANTPTGAPLTPANVTTANAAHTHLGSDSDHAGPPNLKWAADCSIGPDTRHGANKTGKKIGDKIADALAERFGIAWDSTGGSKSSTHDGFRFQLIWQYESAQAGNHYTHVHFGCRVA